MHLIVVISGLAVCGLLALRHAVRTAATVPPVSGVPSPTPQRPQPFDTWQAGIKPDTRADYAPDPATTKRLMEKLRQEELRQRPQERRN